MPKEKQKESGKKELSPEELKKKISDCEKLKEEYLVGWQRARADFLNYKKGELERIGELIKYADTGLILKILPISDNFKIAEKRLSRDLKKNKSIKGFLQIKIQLEEFLEKRGVEKINSLEEKFNPELHEIVEEIEMKDRESGTIIEEIQTGYRLHGKVIRPAKVKVVK